MPDRDAIGLCATCVHSRIVQTNRSTFYLCTLSFVDGRFPKYPPLPVLKCIGYEQGDPTTPPEPPETTDS